MAYGRHFIRFKKSNLLVFLTIGLLPGRGSRGERKRSHIDALGVANACCAHKANLV